MVEKELAKAKDDGSNRRSFVRKLLGLGAAAGVSSMLLGRSSEKTGLLPMAQAVSGSYLELGADDTTNDAGNSTTVMKSSSTAYGGTLRARNTSSGTGLHGYSQNGYGVVGETSSTSGYAYGVVGTTVNAVGVFGDSNAREGVMGRTETVAWTGALAGVHGAAWSGLGVLGESTIGTGVKGQSSQTSGASYGVHGISSSWNGWGLYGLASTTSGPNEGVRGESASTSGTGVLGYAGTTVGDTKGVWGQSDSSTGVGVYGKAGRSGARPMVAQGASGQTNSLQEWQNNAGTALAAVDKNGWFGVGVSSPARSIHLQGNNACFRMDRNANSSAFILVRTAGGNFNTIWKTFYVGVDASGVNNGSFFIGDAGTAVSGDSAKRLIIDNSGNIVPPADNTGSIGKSGTRWADLYVTNLHQGDLVYENGVRSTEEGEGIAFYNPQGTKIAALDREGNLHIKGDVIKDL